MPLCAEVISSITANRNVVEIKNQCLRYGATFTNEQGLGGHMIHCNRYDLLSASSSKAAECVIVPHSRTTNSLSSLSTGSSSTTIVPYNPKVDGRKGNKGSQRRRRYTMQANFDIIEQCDETIASNTFPTIKTPTQYFQYYY